MLLVGAMFKHGLSDVFLTRRGQDVYVHPKITSELRQKQAKRASLRRQLKAMKGRDKVRTAGPEFSILTTSECASDSLLS